MFDLIRLIAIIELGEFVSDQQQSVQFFDFPPKCFCTLDSFAVHKKIRIISNYPMKLLLY